MHGQKKKKKIGCVDCLSACSRLACAGVFVYIFFLVVVFVSLCDQWLRFIYLHLSYFPAGIDCSIGLMFKPGTVLDVFQPMFIAA